MDHAVHGILQARILEWVVFPPLQRIFLAQGWNLGPLHCSQILYQLSCREALPPVTPFDDPEFVFYACECFCFLNQFLCVIF